MRAEKDTSILEESGTNGFNEIYYINDIVPLHTRTIFVSNDDERMAGSYGFFKSKKNMKFSTKKRACYIFTY